LWCNVTNQIYVGSSSGDLKVLYNPVKSRNGIMRSLSKAPKQRRIEDTRFENDQMVFNPSEILEEKQREWEKKNPERFAQQPDHEVFMKPEFYEEALEKTRERKALKKEKER